MGNLWMIFKRYGTVYDMFMAQKRLRNGKRYGFVRFKFVRDVEGLLGQLQKIKIGEEWLRVYVAYDRRSNGYARSNDCGGERGVNGNNENRNYEIHKNGWYKNDGKVYSNGRYVDVVNGNSKTTPTNNTGNIMGMGRTLEIADNDINREILVRSVVGEVKAMCFLSKLSVLCKEQGLERAEVKLLGGLEFMVVLDSEKTASNVLNDNNHGIRRWVHKLRRGDEYDRVAGRVTWINILGVPISYWGENTFRRIAVVHGTLLGFHNCRLEESNLYGRVQIHTCSKGLIREELYVEGDGKDNKDDNDMHIDEEGEGDEESNNEEGNSSDDDGEGKFKEVGDGCHEHAADSDGRNGGEDVESRFSGEAKVGKTFETDCGNYKEKAAVISNMASEDGTDKTNDGTDGDINNEGAYINEKSHVSCSGINEYLRGSTSGMGEKFNDLDSGPVEVNINTTGYGSNIGPSVEKVKENGRVSMGYNKNIVGQEKNRGSRYREGGNKDVGGNKKKCFNRHRWGIRGERIECRLG
ncbi:hypothetical protein CTI12_AA006400 [Artemisia annua]|uniref:RRM domain-containing protein n=1 Tax=Artemisia annua TaxID=35608 RepID=A0A2U1QC67_ARTAN|nr:hypothetical protein CTI12_AA006400 [Artemisia annua]